MASKPLHKALIIIMLGLLTVSAFFIRLHNFKHSELRSIDEVVYYRMALQVLKEGPTGYHTIPYGQELAATGRPLPPYFFQPLFKHPPLFTFMAAVFMKVFGGTMVSAGYVALLFGALMIPLTYWLGALVFGREVGLLAALFIWLDPVSIICSQKVWMETTLSFFSILAVYIFMYAFMQKKDAFYFWAGVAAGAALLTKYTGILAWAVILIFAVVFERELFKNKRFVSSLAVPFVMITPWVYWNFLVHGNHMLANNLQIHNLTLGRPRTIALLGLTAMVVCLGAWELCKPARGKLTGGQVVPSAGWDTMRKYAVIFCGGLLLWNIRASIMRGLDFTSLPVTSWAQGIFWGAPSTFYFGRLIEFSLLFIFSFLAFFLFSSHHFAEKRIFFLTGSVYILFFMVWGSFQSRYLLPAIPFLMVLGVAFVMELFAEMALSKNPAVYLGGRFLLMAAVLCAIFKTYLIDIMLSFPNDMCYF